MMQALDRRRRWRSALIVLAAVAATSAPAAATVSEWLDVYQPLLLDGMTIAPVPYLVRLWGYPQQTEMTDWENRLFAEGKWEDRNLARLFGVRVRLDPAPAGVTDADFRSAGMHGDTLRVVVDVSEALVPPGWSHSPRKVAEDLREVTSLTVRCVRLNAEGERPPPARVDIRVAGNPDLEDLGGVWATGSVAALVPIAAYAELAVKLTPSALEIPMWSRPQLHVVVENVGTSAARIPRDVFGPAGQHSIRPSGRRAIQAINSTEEIQATLENTVLLSPGATLEGETVFPPADEAGEWSLFFSVHLKRSTTELETSSGWAASDTVKVRVTDTQDGQ